MKSMMSLCGALAAVVVGVAMSGCVSRSDYDTCVRRNTYQAEQIESLLAAQESERLRADKALQESGSFEQKQALIQQELEALRSGIQAKQAIIDQLTEQLNQMGPVALPLELSNALVEWASQSDSDLISYDEKTGVVQFKSDLLFDSGKDTVKTPAATKLDELAKILNTPSAVSFDVLVVGHTDDQPIRHAASEHPTNWHLSAHRAIAVEKLLATGGIEQTRLAVMGMGEFRPLEANQPGNKGNPKNRRVEIYIVPSGRIPSAGSPKTETSPQ